MSQERTTKSTNRKPIVHFRRYAKLETSVPSTGKCGERETGVTSQHLPYHITSHRHPKILDCICVLLPWIAHMIARMIFALNGIAFPRRRGGVGKFAGRVNVYARILIY